MTRKILKALTIGAVLGALAVGLLGVVTANAGTTRWVTVKVCPEDAVSVGYGDYSARKGWSKYACIPLDDIGAGKGSWNQDDVRRWIRGHK